MTEAHALDGKQDRPTTQSRGLTVATLQRIEHWGAKRALALFVATLFPGLALDVAIAHFVSGSGDKAVQWVPVWFGGIAAILLAVGAWKGSPRMFAGVLRFVGGLSGLVGVVGLVLHVLPLVDALDGEALTWAKFTEALALHAPPVLAPGAFTLLGLGLIVLASPRLKVSVGS